MNFIEYLSDQSIQEFLSLIVAKYKVLGAVIGAPLVWVGVWLAKKTPWKSDDALVSKLAAMLGVKNDEG